jgi:lipoate-protein ligase A
MRRVAWRLLADAGDPRSTRSGAWHMAVDETLLESVIAGAPPAVRFYTWSPPCLSFGRNQPARTLFDAARAAERGIDIVRRPTGGLAVYHHLELTYSVAAPAAYFGGPRASYHQINGALVSGLRRLGVAATVAGGRGAPVGVGRDPCFQAPAPGEVVVAGRKLVGSAQRCERRAILQHGSVLLDGDQSPVLELQHLPGPSTGAITLRELLGGTPEIGIVQDALAEGFSEQCAARLAPAALTLEELERADRLVARYRSDIWTWRR